MTSDLRDALFASITAALKATQLPFDTYHVEAATNGALATIEAWTASEPDEQPSA
jgi:hypothetical protein